MSLPSYFRTSERAVVRNAFVEQPPSDSKARLASTGYQVYTRLQTKQCRKLRTGSSDTRKKQLIESYKAWQEPLFTLALYLAPQVALQLV